MHRVMIFLLILFTLLFGATVFGQGKKSVLTQAQRDSINTLIKDVLEDSLETRYRESNFTPRVVQRALVTFSFDDANATDYTSMLPLFQAQGEIAVSGIITESIGNGVNLTWSQVLALQSAGWEIAGHEESELIYYTEAQIRDSLTKVKNVLASHGITANNFVYPGGSSNETVRRVTSELYRSGRGIGEGLNTYVPDTYNLFAVNADNPTLLTTYQSWVDSAEAREQWLIFYIHGTDASDETTIGALIDYIQAKGISIVTIDQGLDSLGSVINVGDNFSVNQWGVKAEKIQGPVEIRGYDYRGGSDSPEFDAEVLSSTGWTSTNWTGSWASGWDHTTGNTSALSQSAAAVSATKYQITYTVTGRTAGTFTISFGGESLSGISASGAFGPTATSTAGLIITPTSDFDGAIIVSVKPLHSLYQPLLKLTSSNNLSSLEFRMSSAAYNSFIGQGAGQYNTTGILNSAFGGYALERNTTGYNNMAIGYSSLRTNTVGYGNTAIGVFSMYSNIAGYDNTGIGSDALRQNTTGYGNLGVGKQSLYFNTSGYHNVGLGYNPLFSNTTGNSNIGIGYEPLFLNTIGNQNVGIGWRALYSNTEGASNTATGYTSLYLNTMGTNNTSTGKEALYSNVVGHLNTATGVKAGYNSTGSSNVFLGYNAGSAVTTAEGVIIIGANVTGANTHYLLNIGNVIKGNTATGQLNLPYVPADSTGLSTGDIYMLPDGTIKRKF